ncbi:hypothetical protein ACO0M4_33605 [Streptomyces sp. RGM 3693]|uniref:hypothetical protein n=1 Tax=Streptomyces sp. RGM 3693 TaxID=3413284 RepID=UPI003D2CD82F
MDIEIHQLRYRELIREADHYRLAREAIKTKPPSQVAATSKRRPSRLCVLNRHRRSPWKKRRVIETASPPQEWLSTSQSRRWNATHMSVGVTNAASSE